MKKEQNKETIDITKLNELLNIIHSFFIEDGPKSITPPSINWNGTQQNLATWLHNLQNEGLISQDYPKQQFIQHFTIQGRNIDLQSFKNACSRAADPYAINSGRSSRIMKLLEQRGKTFLIDVPELLDEI